MDNPAPSMLKATLIGGSAAGFVAAIPIVGALNCFCCCLIIGGGFLAAFLYSLECKKTGTEFRAGQGALVGLLAAVFYALVNSLVGGAIQLALGMGIDQASEDVFEMMEQFGGEVPPEAEQVLEFLSGAPILLLVVMSFFITLCIAAIFSTIGGLIGGAVFKVEPPAPAPPAAPPVAPTPGPPSDTPPSPPSGSIPPPQGS
jgi:hypothetical protein